MRHSYIARGAEQKAERFMAAQGATPQTDMYPGEVARHAAAQTTAPETEYFTISTPRGKSVFAHLAEPKADQFMAAQEEPQQTHMYPGEVARHARGEGIQALRNRREYRGPNPFEAGITDFDRFGQPTSHPPSSSPTSDPSPYRQASSSWEAYERQRQAEASQKPQQR